ncbi:DUF6573 family protein [Streptosporangium canum]|uniref:DUF6573 family protein n=1 Tax=Streptosporangium canum TaxID=324952 RepID=UPI00379E7906
MTAIRAQHEDRPHLTPINHGIWYSVTPSDDVDTVLSDGLWPTQQIGYPAETSRAPGHLYLVRADIAMWEPDWTGITLPQAGATLIAATLAGIEATALCSEPFDSPHHAVEAAASSSMTLGAHLDRIAIHGRLAPERLIAVPAAVHDRLVDWEREVALLLEGPRWDLPPLPLLPTTSPAGPELLSEPPSDSPFGQLISSYSRAEALADGELVDVSDASPFRWPTALTRAAWEDCVAWTKADDARKRGAALQDERGRLHDVLTMARVAASRTTGDRANFRVARVPRQGKGVRPRVVTLICDIGPGDDPRPVVTIMTPEDA